jgi:hypothetical protein
VPQGRQEPVAPELRQMGGAAPPASARCRRRCRSPTTPTCP